MSEYIERTTNVQVNYANVYVLLPPSLGNVLLCCFPIMYVFHMWMFLTSNVPKLVDIFCNYIALFYHLCDLAYDTII